MYRRSAFYAQGLAYNTSQKPYFEHSRLFPQCGGFRYGARVEPSVVRYNRKYESV